jgi:phosphorylcholine metabolism protein LicD
MIDLDNAIDNLIDIDKVFRKHNVKYWLQDGTLLGLYRNGNFISHDDDTDIGLFFSDIRNNKGVFNELFNLGFELHKVKGNLENSLLVTIIRNNTSTDLFFYYTEKNKVYHSSFKILTTDIGKKSLQINYFYDPFNVKETMFLNNKFFVPEDEEKFLLTKYGPNWRTPIVVWDHLYDPLNAVLTDIMLNNKLSKQQFKNWISI